jgi:hypothetical protein
VVEKIDDDLLALFEDDKPSKTIKVDRRDMAKKSEPFVVLESDPHFIKPLKPKRKGRRINFNRGKSNKVLTNLKAFAILRGVNKAKRKGDKIMATDNKKTTNKKNKGGMQQSVAWLVFAAQQGFVGYVLLANFSNYIVIAAAGISIGIAGVIVVTHFVRAHQ